MDKSQFATIVAAADQIAEHINNGMTPYQAALAVEGEEYDDCSRVVAAEIVGRPEGRSIQDAVIHAYLVTPMGMPWDYAQTDAIRARLEKEEE